ncbi:glycosyltransferase family 4 protein [Futiania mangrovi]|uniref:Glycosyltransferase family 4 protein n=1 Tax=Futiania mangrovi TaxID=2959716 RepID=A0A9J6PDT3_9PROT|nr:glycosyltransferase family 4 protein [Futiania mangrovii]MCP1335891.1 glycosyltransferase family 4 protein [Futiania mangrovii]
MSVPMQLLRILSVTTLYPNAAMPSHGVFVENRLRHLVASGEVDLRVIAPVPWFPFGSEMFGAYARFASVPHAEVRHGISVTHPRYPVIPKVGMTAAPYLLARTMERAIRADIARNGDVDLIDAHYYYPDGVAAAWVAGRLGKPVVITARGTDINLIPQYPRQRRMVLDAAAAADASITVCRALKDELVALGAEAGKIHVLRNGVDLDMFRPRGRDAARARHSLTRPTVVSVGGLIERKGHHLIVEAMKEVAGADLLIAGDGEMRGALETQIARLGLGDRVRLLGRVNHADLAELYSAADLMVLASSREGWANVLLESMACGTPVAATRIWGTPEVVQTEAVGTLIEERTPAAIANAIRRMLAAPRDRAAVRAYAERFSWDETTAGQLALFREILARRAALKTAA